MISLTQELGRGASVYRIQATGKEIPRPDGVQVKWVKPAMGILQIKMKWVKHEMGTLQIYVMQLCVKKWVDIAFVLW